MGLFGLCYHFVAMPAFPVVGLITIAIGILWAGANEPAMRRRNRQWLITSLLVFVASVAVPICKASYCRGLPTGSFAMAFDRQAWAPMPPGFSEIEDRQKMLADAIKNVVQHGTFDEVRAVLGPTEDASWLDESGGDILSYYMGPARDSVIGIDGEVLVIHFDENGRVVRWYTFID